MPSATAQLGSSGEEHPDNSNALAGQCINRALALKLNLGKLTAQFTWKLTIILIQVFPQKEMARISHCGPSSLIDLVILWLPILLGIHLQRGPASLSAQAAREEQSAGTPRDVWQRQETLSFLLPLLSGDVTHRDISS